MSKRASIAPVDISAVCQRLFAGDCLKLVAFDVGVSAAHLCKRVHEAGLAYTWTTREERALLADLRAGRALVVRADAAPAAARLAERIKEALAEYTHGLSSQH